MIVENEKGLVSFDNSFFMRKFIETVNSNNSTGIDIRDNIRHWNIKPIRTCYYTDYLGEADWRDNWQSLWMVKVVIKTSLETHSLKEGMMEISLQDTSILSMKDCEKSRRTSDSDPVSCMIICRFPKDVQSSIIESAINSHDFSEMQKKYNVNALLLQHIEYTEHRQVQINLGEFSPDFFSSGADYANQIIEICQQLGGIHNCKLLSL